MKTSGSILSIEILLYFLLWISCVFYSIYSVSFEANQFFTRNEFEDTYQDFSKGWLSNRLKDDSDLEWKNFRILILKLSPWIMLHFIVTECFWKLKRSNLWHIILSCCFVLFEFNWKIFLYFILQPILGFLVTYFNSKLIIWLFHLTCLLIINYARWTNTEINYSEIITNSAMFWINLRCLYAFLDEKKVWKEHNSKRHIFINVLTYCLYLPCLFTGPLLSFEEFSKRKCIKDHRNWKELLKGFSRFMFWFFFIELWLHFIYVNALSFQLEAVNNISSWSLYGFGYCMGQFFHLKYVVIYGLSSILAKFDGYSAPETPKCIARIHLYSDMWKYFDRGLYSFLLNHIYIPLLGNKSKSSSPGISMRKVFASMACFAFVYVWHGVQHTFVFIWAILNFLAILLETILKQLTFSTRLHCALVSPLFAMSAIANFYFFAGVEVGNTFVRRFLTDSINVTINVLIVLYFGGQVSTEVKKWEQDKLKFSERLKKLFNKNGLICYKQYKLKDVNS